MKGMCFTDQSRLSTSPLLPDLESTGDLSMATAGISPAPEQLHIHDQHSAHSEVETTGTTRPNLTHQYTLQGQESVESATSSAKLNREWADS